MMRIASCISVLPFLALYAEAATGYQKSPVVKPTRKAARTEDQLVTPRGAHAESVASVPSEESSGPLTALKLRPIVQYSFVSPKAYNSQLASGAQQLGITDTYKIDGAPSFGAAADYAFLPSLLAGVRLEYFSASTAAVGVKGTGGNLTVQNSVTALPAYLTATFDWEVAPRWHLAATGGFGMPLIYRASTEISGSNVTAMPNGTLHYAARPMAGMGLLSAAVDLTSRIALRLEGGYRYLTSNQLKLTENYSTTLKEGELLKDSTNNKNLEVDGGGVFAGAGVSISI